MKIYQIVAEFPDGTEKTVSAHYSQHNAQTKAAILNRTVPEDAAGGGEHGFPVYVVREGSR